MFDRYNSQKWREERLWNKECDMVIKAHELVVQNIFKNFSSKNVKPGQKNFMCVEELVEIFHHSKLYDENFGPSDVVYSFHLSMVTQIDEINLGRIYQMSFNEFLEALARIAEKLSPNKIGNLVYYFKIVFYNFKI